ncbi:MAG: GNAT family N-acetyltransferase [Bacillota bacterium]
MQPMTVGHELAHRLVEKYALVSAEHARTRARLYPNSGAVAEEIAGGYAVFTEPGCPVSGARGLGMDSPVSDQEIESFERFFVDRGVIPNIEICPLADPSLLLALGKRGYGITEFDNVYLRQLDHSEISLAADPKIEVTIASSDQAILWVEAVALGFADGAAITDSSRRIFTTQFHTPKTICYLAWINDKIAGGAMLNLLGGIATLSTTSTLPAFRGRGVQSSLIGARLRSATEAGFDLATMMARPGSASERNAVRAGFQLAYTAARMEKVMR